MSKKHDEGYALIFVLVVMVVLSIIAISLMSGALKNLTNQTATVDRMQEKYTAQGEMEKQIATLIYRLTDPEDKQDLNEIIGLEVAQGKVQTLLGFPELDWKNAHDCALDLKVSKGSVVIECSVVFKNVLSGDGPYKIEKPLIEYTSYSISYQTQETPVEGGGQ